MSLSSPFIHRPVATTLLTAAVALAGIVAFQFLPVAPLPQIDFPTISVQAQLPGASPEIMASSVATPLERQFGRIAGVTEMTSSSYLGTTQVTLQFDLNRDINGAARDVQAAINAARSYLPTNLPANPTYRKVNPADAPIMILALTSKVLDRGPMYDAASTVIQQKLSQIEGVGQVNVGGSSLPAVRVDLNPVQLNNTGLSVGQVASMLQSQNADIPKGQLSDGSVTSDILTNDQLFKADQYRSLVVGYHNGAAIHLSDIADVQDSTQNIRSTGYMNGDPAVLLIIFRTPGANIIDTVDRIRASMPSLKASISQSIDMTVVLDRTTTIRASVHDVERTLVISIALVILVVFLFLRNWRTTLIPSVAVPVSLIGTFGVMYLLNYSLDNLSLMALTISTGFVVDDAIVVIENITRHLENGMKPMEAALHGAKEIGFTVLSISISLIAVFIPILMMGGIVGRLFREFAVTLSIAILVSLAISLTTTPMMCSRLLKPTSEEKQGRFFQASEEVFNVLIRFYEKTLSAVLRHPASTLGLLFLTIAANIYLLAVVPKGFFPEQDNGTVFGGIQGAQDISFQAMDDLTRKFVDLMKSDPSVEHVMAFTGGSGATNSGFAYLGLKPLEDRKISSTEVINRLRPKLTSLPGATVFLQAGQDLRIGGRQSNAQYQYTIQSDNEDDLVKWGPELLAGMKKIPQLVDVNTDQQNQGLETYLTYDRQTAARLGITPAVLDSTLYNAFGQALVSTMYTPLNQYYVVMEAAPQFWQHPEGLNSIFLPTATGGNVPLSAIAHFETKTAPLAVNHQGQFPSVTVSFNLANGVALGDATKAINDMEQNIGMPPTIRGDFSGTLEAFTASLSSEPLLILTALLAVYIVLGILYESYVHPITILSTLPSAGVGAVLVLILFKTDLSVVALIGIILLIGIVKKNAILMIDFALATERAEHKSPKEAIYEACILRFRPILMTTMAALFGAIPMAFGTGTGSELRRPLGITIIGGLIFSQLLTLYTTPVVYLYLDRMRLWWRGRHPSRTRPNGLAPVALGLFLVAVTISGSGCTTGPKYKKPSVEVPKAYKEVNGTIWKPAQPQDAQLRGKWWEMFSDPILNSLEEQVIVNNQNIAAAFASFNEARAIVKEARSAYIPSVSLAPNYSAQGKQGASSSGAGTSSLGTYSQYSVPLNASWQPDVFGRIQATVAGDLASAQVSAADLENEKLTMQADLAVTYYQLRGQDILIDLLNATVKAYREYLTLTQALYKTGIDSDEAVAQAETQLETTSAQATNLLIARAQYEHAIALLVGKPASSFSLEATHFADPLNVAAMMAPPAIPLQVPSDLLERRPDVAAAERSMAAANAQIGVAVASYFPSLSLNGAAGFGSNSSVGLLAVPAFVWSVGAQLAETVFDGGLRSATVEQYQAGYDQAVATYKQTVLTAFQQTEDALAGLRILAAELQTQTNAVGSSVRYLKIATNRFKTGIDPYLNVITAQVTLLTNRETEVTLQMNQMTTSVQLVEALGGGWDVSKLPSDKELSKGAPKPTIW
jgi:multidrug efflux pump